MADKSFAWRCPGVQLGTRTVVDTLRFRKRGQGRASPLHTGRSACRKRAVARTGAGGPGTGPATPQTLRALLAETAKNLFVSERDQRLYRVLELTYLNPAPKQEAVADRLGLSFSTYRRHLTTGVDRLTEWLWRQERGTPQIETIVGYSTERTVMDAPVNQSDNIAAPTDVFRPVPGGDTAANELSAALPLPDKPSVAVLPFTNMIGEPDQEFFPDGIAEDVITALAHYPSLFVIARNSCFTYKGRAVDVKQVGRELGVRYVVEGGVRKAGNRPV